MSDVSLLVERRETFGKNANRRLRASGHVPAVVYGGDRGATSIQVPERQLSLLLRQTADENPVFQLELAGTDKKRHVMIRDMHANPVTGKVLHIDFLRINMDEEIQTSVRLELKGEPKSVKNHGGILDWVTREVEIWALPNAIPGHIDVDVSKLEIGDHIETGSLELPEGVRLEGDGTRVVASVYVRQEEEEETEEEADLDIEPEVIPKGKDEE